MRDTLIIAAIALGLMVFTETMRAPASAETIQAPVTIEQVEIAQP